METTLYVLHINHMKNSLCYYLFFNSILIIACSSAESQNDSKFIEVSKSTLTLNHSDLALNNMSLFNRIVGKDSLLIGDGMSEQLILYDLNSKQQRLIIKTPKEGPDFFDTQLLDAEIQGDKIYVVSRNYFSIYELTGKCIYREKLIDLLKQNESILSFEMEFINPNDILLNRIPFGLISGVSVADDIHKNIFLSLDLQNSIATEIDIQAPESIYNIESKKGYFQQFAIHSMIYEENKIIYSYPYSSIIYTYNISNQKLDFIKANSEYVKNVREPFPARQIRSMEWPKYTYTGSQFSPLEKDDSSEFYARVVSEFKLKADGAQVNEKFLMILDQDLNVIEEFYIDERIIEPVLFTNNKIILKKTDQPNEDEYQFLVYTIDEIE